MHLERSGTKAANRRQDPGALQAEGAGAYRTDAGHQYRANDEGLSQLFTRLEKLLRLLRDALGAEGTGSVDTAQAAIRDLEAVETRESAVRQAMCVGSEQRPGCQNSRKCSRPLAPSQQPRPQLCVPHRLLRHAWTSTLVRWKIAQSVRTAGCGPACPVVWQGWSREALPYADCAICDHGWVRARVGSLEGECSGLNSLQSLDMSEPARSGNEAQQRYSPAEIEPKWQARWDEDGSLYAAEGHESAKPKFYCPEIGPYPSGQLHMEIGRAS